MNEVEAYSTVDGHRVGSVTVPGPQGLSLAPDDSELAVGTSVQHVYFVDPGALHVTETIAIPAALGPAIGQEPLMPFLMAKGPMLIAMISGGSGSLVSYDRTTGLFASADPPGAPVGMGIYGAMPARSGDGNYLAVPMLGTTNPQVAFYSAASQGYVGTTSQVANMAAVAVNSDGSQFAVADTAQITFWGRDLQQQAQVANTSQNIAYSRDGTYLYVREDSDVLALNAQTGAVVGYQGLSLPDGFWRIWDVDDNTRLVGTTADGAFLVSVGQLQSTRPAMPAFASNTLGESIGSPNEGLTSGGTKVEFVPGSTGSGPADGMDASEEGYFGSIPATADAVGPSAATSDGRNSLVATTPAAPAPGPVTVLMTDANNNAVLLPGGFTYGPHMYWLDPSAASPNGGTLSEMRADGLDPLNPNTATVTIGDGKAGLGKSTSHADSWNYASLGMPAGKPGWADLTITLPDGTSETVKNAVQFLAQDVVLNAPSYNSAVYDSTRDRFYLTGANNTVAVFDVATKALVQPLQSTSISSNAVLGSVALTPDNSKLVVSDPTDQSAVVFNLSDGTSQAVRLVLPTDPAGPWSGRTPVATSNGDRAFILVTSIPQNPVREIDLTTMTVQARTDVAGAGLFKVQPSTEASSADGSTVVLGGSNASNSRPFYAWKYDAASDTFSTPTTVFEDGYPEVATNSDGSVLDLGGLVLSGDLTPQVPVTFLGIFNQLTASGGLRYSTSADLGVNISDTRNGRTLLNLPSVEGANALAIDPTGRKVLVSGYTNSRNSLSYFELSVVPLAVGTVSPTQATPGTTITIRGDGFVSGTSVTIGGQRSACVLSDEQTLKCAVPAANAGLASMTLTNPDGQTYSLESALTVK